MLTIPEIDKIAKRATECIAKEFAESGFSNPPVVTHGIARAVLEAAEHRVHQTASGDGTHYDTGHPDPMFLPRESRTDGSG